MRLPVSAALVRSGNGALSVHEFFLWSLGNAAAKHGSTSLKTIFEKYDKDGTGTLDASEFEKACEQMVIYSSPSNPRPSQAGRL